MTPVAAEAKASNANASESARSSAATAMSAAWLLFSVNSQVFAADVGFPSSTQVGAQWEKLPP